MTLQELRDVLREAGIPVAHYKTQLTEYPCIVFRELSASYSNASGQTWRETINVAVDYFTKTEWDATVDRIKMALLRNKIKFTTDVIWYSFQDNRESFIGIAYFYTIGRDLYIVTATSLADYTPVFEAIMAGFTITREPAAFYDEALAGEWLRIEVCEDDNLFWLVTDDTVVIKADGTGLELLDWQGFEVVDGNLVLTDANGGTVIFARTDDAGRAVLTGAVMAGISLPPGWGFNVWWGDIEGFSEDTGDEIFMEAFRMYPDDYEYFMETAAGSGIFIFNDGNVGTMTISTYNTIRWINGHVYLSLNLFGSNPASVFDDNDDLILEIARTLTDKAAAQDVVGLARASRSYHARRSSARLLTLPSPYGICHGLFHGL